MKDYYMMWLSEIKGISRKDINLLISKFEYPENVWKANKTEIEKLIGFEKASLLIKSKDTVSLRKKAAYLEKNKIEYISIQNDKYPYLLKNIFDPPFGLYIRGELPSDDNLFISIIGSRNCTAYGAKNARKFSYDLAENGAVIVSGMADGIDSIANKWAMEAGGKTIAVLGTGIDMCYPYSKRTLMEEIAEKGCLITEFSPGTPPSRWTFPKRNRIISGLSNGVLLIEAKQKSGTISTIDHALENGREVFVIPGDILNEAYAGSNEMLLNGAHIAIHPENILEHFKIDAKIKIEKNKRIQSEENKYFQKFDKKVSLTPEIKKDKNEPDNFINYEGLTDNEKLIFDIIKENAVNIEELTAKLDIPVFEIQAHLTSLEIKGIIKELPGNRYMKI